MTNKIAMTKGDTQALGDTAYYDPSMSTNANPNKGKIDLRALKIVRQFQRSQCSQFTIPVTLSKGPKGSSRAGVWEIVERVNNGMSTSVVVASSVGDRLGNTDLLRIYYDRGDNSRPRVRDRRTLIRVDRGSLIGIFGSDTDTETFIVLRIDSLLPYPNDEAVDRKTHLAANCTVVYVYTWQLSTGETMVYEADSLSDHAKGGDGTIDTGIPGMMITARAMVTEVDRTIRYARSFRTTTYPTVYPFGREMGDVDYTAYTSGDGENFVDDLMYQMEDYRRDLRSAEHPCSAAPLPITFQYTVLADDAVGITALVPSFLPNRLPFSCSATLTTLPKNMAAEPLISFGEKTFEAFVESVKAEDKIRELYTTLG